MKYEYTINFKRLTNAGNPIISFMCTDCKRRDLDLPNYVYSANLSVDPRIDLDKAVTEFSQRLKDKDSTLFKNPRSLSKLYKKLCQCDPELHEKNKQLHESENPDSFPLYQWFDLTKKIDKLDADDCEAQMALYAVKEGLDPDNKKCREEFREMHKAVKLHNKKFNTSL